MSEYFWFEVAKFEHGDKSMMGLCPVCGKRVPINLDDTLRKHFSYSYYSLKASSLEKCRHSRSNPSRIDQQSQTDNQDAATVDRSNGNTKDRPMQKGNGNER